MQKIILDTNVLISGLINPKGIPAKILKQIISGDNIILCLSVSILKEYREVTSRKKFKSIDNFTETAENVINYLENTGIFFSPTTTINKLKDKSDNKFLELAVESEADFIITGDKKDFNIEVIGDTRIVPPGKYWAVHK